MSLESVDRKREIEDLEFYLEKPIYTLLGASVGPEEKKVNVIGVPLEDTVSFRPGTRFAPDVLRSVSRFVEYSSSSDSVLSFSLLVDCGNVALLQGAVSRNLDRIRRVGSVLLRVCRGLLVVGGEHTLTLALADVLAERGNVLLVVFDSHLDLKDEWPPGQEVSHATFLRRLLEKRQNITVLHVGSHAFDEKELRFLEENKSRLIRIGPAEAHPGRLSRLVRDLSRDVEHVYISIDVDILDPAQMPATSNPEGVGLSYRDLTCCLQLIAQSLNNKIRIVDIVEYNPLLDQGYTYATRIIKLMIDTVTSIWQYA